MRTFFFCTDKNVTVWFLIFSGIKIDEKEFSCQNHDCERKQLIQKCDINSGMWQIWRSHRLERDGIYSKDVWVRRTKHREKKVIKQKPQSDSISFPRKQDSGRYCFWYWMHLKSKIAFIQRQRHRHIYTQNVDGFTKRMFNKKSLAFFYIEPQRADKCAKKNWQSNLSLRTVKYFCGFFFTVVNIRNMLMKTHNNHQIIFHKQKIAFASNNKKNGIIVCFWA